MKIKIQNLLIGLMLVCLVSAYGEDSSTVSEENAFERLYFQIKKQRLKGKDCEKLGYVDETGGRVNLTSGTDMSFDNEFEGCRFEIELRNKEEVRLKDIKMECRFFYMEGREWRARTRKQEEEVKYIDCSLSCTLEPGARQKINTDAFVMNSYAYPSGVYRGDGGPEVVECKPEGIWIRITYKTSDGKKLEREICDPKSLSKDTTWEGKSI